MSPDENKASSEPLSIYAVLAAFVDQLAMVAWQKLGLQPDMITGAIHKDIAEAKVAIDVATHLASFVEPKLDEEDKRTMHNLIRDLRINYVEQTKP